MNSEILDILPTDGHVKVLNIYDRISSTNVLAKNTVKDYFAGSKITQDSLILPQLFIADSQTAGRGRMKRVWVSPPETGIWMSYLIKPDITPDRIPQITILAALAVAKAIKSYGNRNSLPVSPLIKWPNDIVLNQKKICGILTELVSIPVTDTTSVFPTNKLDSENYNNFVVCGIGINVNTDLFPVDLRTTATSLFLETGVKWIREEIITDIVIFLNEYISKFEKSESLEFIREEYNELLINMNKEVRIIDSSNNESNNNNIYISKGIDENGALLVADSLNNIQAISSGEVSVRGLYGYT